MCFVTYLLTRVFLFKCFWEVFLIFLVFFQSNIAWILVFIMHLIWFKGAWRYNLYNKNCIAIENWWNFSICRLFPFTDLNPWTLIMCSCELPSIITINDKVFEYSLINIFFIDNTCVLFDPDISFDTFPSIKIEAFSYFIHTKFSAPSALLKTFFIPFTVPFTKVAARRFECLFFLNLNVLWYRKFEKRNWFQ